jgi:hypothetical protein
MPIDELLDEASRRAFGALTRALATIVVAMSLVCCTRQPEPARHTVAEYHANPELRRERFARCSDDPGTLGSTPDCINVRQATLLEDSRSIRELPPVQLPPPPSRQSASPPR